MKKKLCLCYCPAVVDTDDSADHFSPNSVQLSTKVVRKELEEKALLSSGKSSILKLNNKSIHKLPSRKIFPYKYFPRLLKAMLFQDPVKKLQQLEYELKSNGWNNDEKCFNKLDNHESRKPEMKVEEVNQIRQENVTFVSHESPKSSSSDKDNAPSSSKSLNGTKANTYIASVSCDEKRTSCSLLYLIVFALLMTVFLGKYWAIVLTLSWVYSTPYRGQYFQQRENAMKSVETKS